MLITLGSGETVDIDPSTVPIISSRQFHWHAESSSFTAEASELEHEMERLGHRRLRPCQGRHGFIMRSHRTGKLVWFEREREIRDGEGDLVSVEFTCPSHQGIKLTVFND